VIGKEAREQVLAAAGRLLDGYDFITDPVAANDGTGRDADASDPGDWCEGSDSSWHGTRVSGIVGAMTNNASGVAGITWQGRILPVRVLGNAGQRLTSFRRCCGRRAFMSAVCRITLIPRKSST
jgi:subtilisin family serine protease